ncbi:hypothetical protein GF1_25960 [Desulfolithobacter dissulfuricans]|uniref:DNA primase n=1 Tax=Desulfolithobacter dissulfuricans TaxID=2795293 RepID=A0A915UB27_9BACT|nr:DNA primase [Desulfolithobacter dissulfuricans]BCO10220.1 hypothetical protein GF1_25960 [Desulfolithobacter dissulfuricans]
MADLREEVKNRVRDAADIVQVIGECVELKKAGSRYTGLCPFHAEKTPSFSVNPQGQFFHCFGCGESGDVFSFVMKYHHLSFPEALKELARRYQIDLPEPKLSEADRKRIRQRERLYRVNEEAAELYHRYLLNAEAARGAREYLRQRDVPETIIRTYRLGYAPDPEVAGWNFITDTLRRKDLPVVAIEQAGLAVRSDRGTWYDRFRDRVLFPIYDMTGRVVAFGGRILGDGKPKYMNSPESQIFDKSRILFGLYQHREAIRRQRQAIVVEGNFDLLLLAVHSIDNVVAPLGTALTRAHVRTLRGYCDEAVLLFDGDRAGLKAAMRSIPFFLAEQVDARVALLPEGDDPDTLVRRKGADAVLELVKAAKPLDEFVFEALVREHGLTLEGKNRIIGELRQVIAGSSDEGQRSLMVAHFSEKLGISPGQLLSGIQPGKAAPEEPVLEDRPRRRLSRQERQLIDFLILYPEFIEELLANGLHEVVQDPGIRHFIDTIVSLTGQGEVTPERILSAVTDERQRRYVAEVLIRGVGTSDEEREQEARRFCDELLAWLESFRYRQNAAKLLAEINEAQRSGDRERLMILLEKKQEMSKKNLTFSYKLLKE